MYLQSRLYGQALPQVLIIEAACRAKSTADMINKLMIVEEELDESMYWLELIQVRFSRIKIDILYKEANELLSIIVASIITLKRKIRNS